MEKETDQIGKRLRSISAELKGYIEKRIELMMINFGEETSRMLAQSVHKAVGFALMLVALVFLLFALAVFLGDLLDSPGLGYLLVSLPMLLVGWIFISLRPASVTKKIQGFFESEILKAFDQENRPSSSPKYLQGRNNSEE